MAWYQKAAEKGHVGAQRDLGCYYLSGEDYKLAVIWLRKAAEQGNAYAQLNMGNCYLLDRDHDCISQEEALSWLNKATKSGDEEIQKEALSTFSGIKSGSHILLDLERKISNSDQTIQLLEQKRKDIITEKASEIARKMDEKLRLGTPSSTPGPTSSALQSHQTLMPAPRPAPKVTGQPPQKTQGFGRGGYHG